jgi:hypothetical protein
LSSPAVVVIKATCVTSAIRSIPVAVVVTVTGVRANLISIDMLFIKPGLTIVRVVRSLAVEILSVEVAVAEVAVFGTWTIVGTGTIVGTWTSVGTWTIVGSRASGPSVVRLVPVCEVAGSAVSEEVVELG